MTASGQRPRAWLLPAVASAAMLLLPALAWLLAPRPPAVKLPPLPVETVVAPTETAPPPKLDPPRPHAAAPPTASAAADEGVTGVVVDASGAGVAGAFVACDDDHQVPSTSTDDRGHFHLPAEAAGCTAVSTHATFVGSDRVRLALGKPNVITLQRGGGIEGEVVDERGGAVASYQLAIESYQGPSKDQSPLGQVRPITDPAGSFRWEGLPAGTYVLTAVAAGQPPARSRDIEVENDRLARRVRIVIPRGATLSGRVIDADTKQPLAGASVGFDALTSAGMGGGWTRTDASGAYKLDGAPPGPFSIRVAHEGYVNKIIAGLVTRGADTLHQDAELRRFVEGGPRDELAGIGAVLAPTAAGVRIGSLVAGGPAETAGLRKGDRILRIDGVDASTMPMSDCVQRLRGAEGSIVGVQVEREGRRVDVSITRKVVGR